MTIDSPPRTNKSNRRALLLGLFLVVSAVSLCGLSVLMVVLALVPKEDGADLSEQLSLLLLAGGFFFSAILLIPGIYLNGRIFFNFVGFQIQFPPVRDSILFILLATLWVPVLALGGVIASNRLTAIILPVLNILAVGLPVICFLRLALRNLELPPAQHAWSVFGVTLVAAPIIGVILEGVALIVFVFIAGLYAFSANPALAQQITRLAEAVQQTKNSDTLVTLIAPLLFTPGGMLILFGLFSVAVPAIEEAAKVMALWLFADKIKHPIEGFALGVLCGAAFALAENLGFSSAGSGAASSGVSEWTATVAQRASAILPHMLNSEIWGWALVSAWKARTYLKLGVAYLAVMLIHGLWNAISLGLALNSLISYTQQPIPPMIAEPTPLLIGWAVMMIGTFGGLVYCNRVSATHPQ